MKTSNFVIMNKPLEIKVEENVIIMKAGEKTNLFNDMCSDYKVSNFPYYYTEIEGDFTARCKVSPTFIDTYDLGSLVVFENEDKWIKLAFENSDTGKPSIVSVITDGLSDDCNGEAIGERGVWLQIVRQGNNFALHHSFDKENWKLARIFRLDMPNVVKVGLSAQSPLGKECITTFEDLEILDNIYKDIRLAK